MSIRPQIIRADTLDLQDHDSPSAQDHTQQPEHPQPLGRGPAAPHQDASLRHLHEDRNAEQDYLADSWGSSARSSHEGSELLDEDVRLSTEETTLDEAAIQQNGGDNLDASDADGDDQMDDDLMDDRVSSSPSINDEDISFEFVYALHNFVATVEGQANATKGDQMVLLDDSNSYWWLVRVVKDNSIGYLPAEHIETPTERLARYNKKRNLEVSQSMLQDVPEKSKNPLKKAMRRRNAKAVQFTAPTYYEPTEYAWSDDESESELQEVTEQNASADVQDGESGDQEDTVITNELSTAAPSKEETAQGAEEPAQESSTTSEGGSAIPEEIRPAQEADNDPDLIESNTRKSRNGTIRNTDSFFKDDTAEPRKISLTPNLLRDESIEEAGRSSGSTDQAPRQDIFDQIERSSSTSEKSREDRKRKEKKPGMLSGLFKRKDKKIKVDEAAGGTVVQHGDETGSPILTPGDSAITSPTGRGSPTSDTTSSPRQLRKPNSTGKLTKAPPPGVLNAKLSAEQIASKNRALQPTGHSMSTSNGQLNSEVSQTPTQSTAGSSISQTSTTTQSNSDQPDSSGAINPTAPMAQGSGRDEVIPNDTPSIGQNGPTLDTSLRTSENPTTISKPSPSPAVSTTSDSTTPANLPSIREVPPVTEASPSPPPKSQPYTPTAPVSGTSTNDASNIKASTSATSDLHHRSLSSPNETAAGVSAFSSSPNSSTASPTSPTFYTTTTTPTDNTVNGTPTQTSSSDAALIDYINNKSAEDARNLLIIVNDTTGTKPLPLDHPSMLDLGFRDQQKRLDEIERTLDGALNGFLARKAARPKNRTHNASASNSTTGSSIAPSTMVNGR